MVQLKVSTQDNEFEEKGIEFKIISEDMFENVKTFMWENFFPDEPVSRYLPKQMQQGLISLSFVKILRFSKW